MTDQKTIHELIERVDTKMRESEYSEKTLVLYETIWKSFKAFAKKENIRFNESKLVLGHGLYVRYPV